MGQLPQNYEELMMNNDQCNPRVIVNYIKAITGFDVEFDESISDWLLYFEVNLSEINSKKFVDDLNLNKLYLFKFTYQASKSKLDFIIRRNTVAEFIENHSDKIDVTDINYSKKIDISKLPIPEKFLGFGF
jgi:hypothetical protein